MIQSQCYSSNADTGTQDRERAGNSIRKVATAETVTADTAVADTAAAEVVVAEAVMVAAVAPGEGELQSFTPRPCRWRHAKCRRGTWSSTCP